MHNPIIEAVGKGCSFFKFVEKYCLQERTGTCSNPAVHRLCSLARKMDVKTAIMEELPPMHEEIRNEYIALCSYFEAPSIELKAYKGTFIIPNISHVDEVKHIKDENFLASFIIINFKDDKNLWKSYLFNAIFTLPQIVNHPQFKNIPLLNNYIHIYRIFKNNVTLTNGNNHEFNITGTFFSQQNSVTSVCAHAALCMTINNMNRVSNLITSEDINKICGINHVDIKFGKGNKLGLDYHELLKVLEQYGLTYTLFDFFENPNVSYDEIIYNYAESGCPVLLVFTTTDISHIVPILGHTLNTDIWRPEAEIAYHYNYFDNPSLKSSSAWADNFIMHDDNFGMFLCLPVDALKRVTLPKHDPTFRAHYAVIIKPKEVTTPAWEAKLAVLPVLNKALETRKKTGDPLDIWTERLLKRSNQQRTIVLRTFWAQKEEYLENLKEKDFLGKEFSDKDKNEIMKNLPSSFWLSELTLPELYTANKTKIIDFIYTCDSPALENDKQLFERWIQIRFPYGLIRKNADHSFEAACPLSVGSHYPLSCKGTDKLLEW